MPNRLCFGLLFISAAAAVLHAQCALDLAIQLHQAGDLPGAIREYRACIAADPNRVEARSNLGAVLAKLGRYQQAIDEYRAALNVAPPDVAPRLKFNLALAYYKSFQIPEAAAELESLHRSQPSDLNLALLLADCRLRMGEFQAAIDLLTPLEPSHPDQPALDYVLGMALIRHGRVAEGQARVDRILRRGDSAEGHFLLGAALFTGGNYPEAVTELSKAAALNPDVPSLQSYYGQALLFTGDADGATQAFRKELAANPNDFDANFQLASILSHRGKPGEARPLLERAVQVRPGSLEARDALANGFRPDRPAQTDPGIVPRTPAPPIATLDWSHLSKPIVLVFGSYTCPKLRGSAADLKHLAETYRDRVDFRLVYVREAHAGGGAESQWQSTINIKEGISLAPARTLPEKQDHAALCLRKLDLPFPAVVDGMDGAAETAYQAWPSRLYVIGNDGKVAFQTRLGELDFQPAELDAAIREILARRGTEVKSCGRFLGLAVWLAWVAAAQPQPSPEAILRHAVDLHQAGDIPGAIAEYRAYLKQAPKSVMARSNLGAALSKSGQYEAAIVEYRQALELEPRNLPVRVNLGLALYKTAQIPAAAEELAKAVKQQPSNRQAVFLLADCDLRLGENKKVIELLAPLEKESPDDKALIYLLGTALIRDNQPARGQLLVDHILREGESAEAQLLLGTTKMNAQDFAGALVDLKKAADLNPQLPDVFSYYGLALLSTGDVAAAATAFRKELESNPDDFVSNLQLGALLKQDQHYDEARTALERALRVRPGDPGVRYQMATLDLVNGNIEQACSQLEQLIKESPQFVEAHVSLATVYYRLKRKADGDRERATVLKLNAESQANQPGAKE